MNSIKFASLLCLCLVASALAAPTETPAGQDASSAATSAGPSPAPATEAPAPSAATEAPKADVPAAASAATTVAPAAPSEAPVAPSAPATDAPAAMPVSQSHDNMLNSSMFTCYGRPIGYYADTDHTCKVYHFCLLGEYNGEAVYQRISYLCLNDTVFDQQALDCVEPAKAATPCKDAPSHYELSNKILRQAIVGTRMNESNQTEASPAAPAPTAAAPSPASS